jgi:hypothetical protein
VICQRKDRAQFSYLQELNGESSSDKVRDVWIAKPLSPDLPSLAFVAPVFSAGGRATNTRVRVKSEWIAIADSAGVFTADIVGIETIAKGSSGK